MRRRRPVREKVVFGFDSFLDVVANVIGIIIKLILVTWVGARAYSAGLELLKTEPDPAAVAPSEKPAPTITDDPLYTKVDLSRGLIDEARSRLLERMRNLEGTRETVQTAEQQIVQLRRQREKVDQERQALEQNLASQGKKIESADLSVDQLRRRSQELLNEIKTLESQPSLKKLLTYHTPVSRSVEGDELFFECKDGRITFIDLQAFLQEVQGKMDGLADELRTKRRVDRTTGPVGPYRLRYTFEKDEGFGGNFRYGLSSWELEPLAANRGETLEGALAPGSAFRRLTDNLDANLTVVTLWVYPDSFELFRRMRDVLYEREIEVAGRPLPHGAAIAASRHGTKSRGQ